MKRRRSDTRCLLFEVSERPNNAITKASLCDKESWDDNEEKKKNTKTAPVHAKHCRGCRDES